MNKAEVFRELHGGPQPLILPNAWDFGSAAVLAQEFPAIGTTSLGVAVAAGLADGMGVSRTETLALATRLARLAVPVTVDIEGGFGADPNEVAEFVAALGDLGIAGVNLEDSRSDSTLVTPSQHARVVAAVKARTPAVFINTRVDTHWLRLDQDSTLDRARRYADAGADGIFVPGATDPALIARIVASVDVPVNMLYSANGPSIRSLTDLGVRRISTGSLLYRGALAAALDIAKSVRADTPPPFDLIPDYRRIAALTNS
ncbi:isocitrate lyase/phosphoenolpyruvate mutase family protein [Nocardia panacis]|uniref:Isocitrate lyase/phosphoenolpyruvate mutase family protein n=1 Tax=Nocardia panacis TaxID=2340916 RepID=A0A3A4K4T4_9NOCA|nr:isocitrate lyase/phosphoenolpyruvate mutase family protein [Nocardia panacis]RJO69284.1 isocitrate lyase/phosphoenolpyruvate mutase family protein [Nocardia panacis]